MGMAPALLLLYFVGCIYRFLQIPKIIQTVENTDDINSVGNRFLYEILSYTLGDAYTLEYWVDMAKKIEAMGADSICIKDMAGLLVPYKATQPLLQEPYTSEPHPQGR